MDNCLFQRPALDLAFLKDTRVVNGNRRLTREEFVGDEIALADKKFGAHKAHHLFNGDMPFAYEAFALLGRAGKGSSNEVITIILEQVDDCHAKAGAGANRGDYLLQNLIEAQFGAQDITQADQFFDLTCMWRFASGGNSYMLPLRCRFIWNRGHGRHAWMLAFPLRAFCRRAKSDTQRDIEVLLPSFRHDLPTFCCGSGFTIVHLSC